jgi:hypothetical protein
MFPCSLSWPFLGDRKRRPYLSLVLTSSCSTSLNNSATACITLSSVSRLLGTPSSTTGKGRPRELGSSLRRVCGRSPTVFAHYQARSVCTEGVKAPRDAGPRLFPPLPLVLCYLPSILKIKERCRGALRRHGLARAGRGYQAATKGQFSQRLRRLSAWATATRAGPGAEMVSKVCQPREDLLPASAYPQAARTTNAIDRLHDHLDRVLSALRSCHGQQASARLAMRAWAMQWNCHPSGPRVRHDQPARSSPFDDLNGFHYHPNWLQNCLIASSIGGLRW